MTYMITVLLRFLMSLINWRRGGSDMKNEISRGEFIRYILGLSVFGIGSFFSLRKDEGFRIAKMRNCVGTATAYGACGMGSGCAGGGGVCGAGSGCSGSNDATVYGGNGLCGAGYGCAGGGGQCGMGYGCAGSNEGATGYGGGGLCGMGSGCAGGGGRCGEGYGCAGGQ